MKNQGTFKNLATLKKVQDDVKLQLGENYNEIIEPYMQIIQMVMKANDENEFSALKRIKETLVIYKKPDAPMFFSAALIDITESKHFKGFANLQISTTESDDKMDITPSSVLKRWFGNKINNLKS